MSTSTRLPCHVTPDCPLDQFGDAPAEWWTDGAYLAVAEEHHRHEEAWAAEQPVGPCPFWCSLPDGHPWRSDIGTLLCRRHEYDCGDGIAVQQTEGSDGNCTEITVWDGGESLEVGAAEARAMAAALLNAADKLDEITGGAA